jgi:phage-related protein
MQFHKGTGYVADRYRYSQRDGIRSATASPQRQERRFGHSQMITDSTEQLTENGAEETRTFLTERPVAITKGNQVKTFSVYYNVVSPLVATSSYFDERQTKSTSSAGGCRAQRSHVYTRTP